MGSADTWKKPLPEGLDRVLLRPWRFDRQAVVDAPDREARDARCPDIQGPQQPSGAFFIVHYLPMGKKKSEFRSRLALLDPAVARGLVARLRLTQLLERFSERPVWAVFMFINGFVTIAILAAVAMISHTPFIFPSLGPTAILLFYTPLSPTASPRHTLYGHAIGILCGYGSLLLMGLHHAPPTVIAGVDPRRVMAAALSLAFTGALMIILKAAHPPAGATTLIVSLGIVAKPFYLLVIEVAVAALVGQAIVINRLAGLDYPVWARRQGPPGGNDERSASAPSPARND